MLLVYFQYCVLAKGTKGNIYIYIYILRTYVCMCVMIYKIIYVFFLSKMNQKQDHMTKITYELPLQLLHTKLQNDSFKHV